MAKVKYRKLYFNSRDHEMVSEQWFTLLYNLHRAHVHFNVNEGHRTKGRQQELIDEKGLWSPSNPRGAAAVSDNAPHIRTGRHDHAIDFDGADAVIRAAGRRGVTVRRTISTEPWHLEADASELAEYHKKKAAGVAAHIKKNKK